MQHQAHDYLRARPEISFLQQYKSDTQKSALAAESSGSRLSQGKTWDISVSSTGVIMSLKVSASVFNSSSKGSREELQGA